MFSRIVFSGPILDTMPYVLHLCFVVTAQRDLVHFKIAIGLLLQGSKSKMSKKKKKDLLMKQTAITLFWRNKYISNFYNNPHLFNASLFRWFRKSFTSKFIFYMQ